MSLFATRFKAVSERNEWESPPTSATGNQKPPRAWSSASVATGSCTVGFTLGCAVNPASSTTSPADSTPGEEHHPIGAVLRYGRQGLPQASGGDVRCNLPAATSMVRLFAMAHRRA